MSTRALFAAAGGPAAPAYRYWRLYITDVQSGGSTGLPFIYELELRAVAGGADLTVAGVTPITASSQFDNGEGVFYPATSAIDNSLTSPWGAGAYTPATPAWLRVDLGAAKPVRQVAIYTPAIGPDNIIKTFKIQASGNDAAWTDMATIVATPTWTGWKTFDL